MLDTIVSQLDRAERLGDWLAPLRRDYRPWPSPAQPLVIPQAVDLDGLRGIVKVFFIKRRDGSVYATTKKRNLYGEVVLDVTEIMPSRTWSVMTCPLVEAHLKYWQAKCTTSTSKRK